MEEKEINYIEVLEEKLNHLDEYKRIEGGEGVAYFDGPYVIKEYNKYRDFEILLNCFDDYCKEMRDFLEKNAPIPKIYAWTRKYTPVGLRFYILEELIQGREIYSVDPAEFAYDLCDLDVAKDVIDHPFHNLQLYAEIMSRFVDRHISSHEYLLNMPEAKLKKFIQDCFQLYVRGNYTSPDLHPTNILVGENKLILIDPQINCRKTEIDKKNLYYNFCILLLNIFYSNDDIVDCQEKVGYLFPELDKKIKKNNEYLREVLLRFFQYANEYMNKKSIKSPESFEFLLPFMYEIFTKEENEEFVRILNNEFAKHK